MDISLLTRPLVGLGCVAGIGSAIGVPVAYAFKSTQGEGISQVSVSECNEPTNSGGAQVSFGSQQKGDICWQIEPPTWGPSISLGDKSKYTEILQKMWDSKTAKLESLETENWKVSCTEGKWSFSTASDGKEGLGLCKGGNKPDNQEWIRIERKNSEIPKIEVCKGICFQSNIEQQDQQRTLDPNKKTWNWYSVLFRVKSA